MLIQGCLHIEMSHFKPLTLKNFSKSLKSIKSTSISKLHIYLQVLFTYEINIQYFRDKWNQFSFFFFNQVADAIK